MGSQSESGILISWAKENNVSQLISHKNDFFFDTSQNSNFLPLHMYFGRPLPFQYIDRALMMQDQKQQQRERASKIRKDEYTQYFIWKCFILCHLTRVEVDDCKHVWSLIYDMTWIIKWKHNYVKRVCVFCVNILQE